MADDFAAYVMHGANLAEGRPYTAIHFIPNPEAMWLAPAQGYPPVYPLLLAPVYKLYGLNLKAMKILTVSCFGIFLIAYVLLIERVLPLGARLAAIVLVGFNAAFWEQRNYLLSEFPYLMFSFCALLVAQRVYRDLDPGSWRLRSAVGLAVLVYCAYGTRTIGIALLFALILADLLKNKRPSNFLIAVTAFTLLLIILQTVVVISPRSYLDAVHLSAGAISQHTVYYGKTLSYVWLNGFSKMAQIAFALLFTTLAGIGFIRKAWNRKSPCEFYLLIYLAILIAWSAEIGLRGLLPLLPLYFSYALEEISRILAPLGKVIRWTIITALCAVAVMTYLGAFRHGRREEHLLDVQDQSAKEVFAFLRANTQPSDVLVFPKPRTLALFTNRNVAALALEETPAQALRFLREIHAKFLVESKSIAGPMQYLTGSHTMGLTEIFHNADFQVYRIDLRDGSPAPPKTAE